MVLQTGFSVSALRLFAASRFYFYIQMFCFPCVFLSSSSRTVIQSQALQQPFSDTFSPCSIGASHKPAQPSGSAWDLPAGLLHRPGLHAAALQAGAAGAGAGGEVVEGVGVGQDRTLIQVVFGFQFLGDPHLTISHVNYKLDQVILSLNLL